MYEERFIDRIFGEDQQFTREDFVTAIEGSAAQKALEALNDFQFFKPKKKKLDNPDDTDRSMLEDMADGPVDWLFSPKAIRQLFRQQYKQVEIKNSLSSAILDQMRKSRQSYESRAKAKEEAKQQTSQLINVEDN